MDREKRRSLIALVIALLLIAILATILFIITIKVFPGISLAAGVILSVVGAALLSAAGFFSGLKDTYDFVLDFIDTFFDDPSKKVEINRSHTTQKLSNPDLSAKNVCLSSQGNIVAAAIGKEASVQAKNIAGRDINIFNYGDPLGSTTISVLANQIEKLGENLSVQAQQRLVTLKNAWREGKRQETLQELQELRQDRDFWAALSDETKAKYLCFEGNIQLHLNENAQIARELADEANSLTSTSNEAQLRASIAFTTGQIKEAIEVLADWDDPESLHFKAALYLESQKPVQCLEILETFTISSNPTAETYRLRALSYLVKKEIGQAQLEIQKALELSPSWESIKFSAMLINFYSTISLGSGDDLIVISPEPISWMSIKRDDESLSRLRHAADRIQDLLKHKEQTIKEINRLHAWYLACLANHPGRQDEAALYCHSLLDKDPAFALAINWALARNYNLNFDASEAALEEFVTNNTTSIYHILTLANCYIADHKPDETIELLEQREGVFREHGATDVWLYSYAQAQVLKGSPELALQKINSYEQEVKAYHARMFVLHHIAQKTNDWQALNDFLIKNQTEANNPDVLLDVCEIKAEQQDWLYIIEHWEALLNRFETTEVLSFIVIAAYNIEHFQLCLQLLDDNRHLFPKSKLPLQFRQIRVSCQREMGILPQAILEAENLASEIHTLENLLPLVNLYVMKGDFKRLVITASQLERFPDLPPQIALWVSRLLIWEDSKLALSFWHKATEKELPDELVGEAFFTGHQLGLKTELKPLSLRLQKLGQEGRGGIHVGPAHELLEIIKEGHEHGAKVDEAYRTGQVPVHLVSQEFNLPLATLYHSRLLENERASDFYGEPPLLARHGGRMPIERFLPPVSNMNLHLDITAVLLAEHLEILSLVEQSFAPLRISAELIPALIQLREQITHHQPARFEEHKKIIALVNNGAITILNEELSQEYDNPTLIAEMGRDWAILAETARKTNGFLVDYLPLTKNDLSGDSPSTLPKNIDKSLTNCRALVESLLQKGPLSIEEYHRVLEELGNEGQVEPSETIPQQGSLLYCYGAILETFARVDLLAILCQRFQVHISNQLYERIKAGYAGYLYMQTSANWVDNLISRLNRGLDKQLYRIIPISPNKIKQIDMVRSQHPLDGVLASLLGFERQDGDVIWTDDRWLNSHRHRDGIPIVDIYDILKFLVGIDQMNKAKYYQSLHKLRIGNVIFIPVQRDEIVYHLRQAQINSATGTVIETQQLKVLRQYVASCLLQKNIIQKPPMPPGSPNEQGETAFLVNFARAVGWALFDIWADNNITEEERPIFCEWIISNLYLDYLALFRATSIPIEEENKNYLSTLGLITILMAPFTSPTGFSDTETLSKKTYFSWLYNRLLQKRFSADPQLLTSTLESLKDSFERVKEDSKQKGFDLIAIDLLLQAFYDLLPEPIQLELRKDVDFMLSFGLKFIPVVSIGNLDFEQQQFFQAAYKAVNGHNAIISPVQSNFKITFEPIKNEIAIKFIDPNTNKETRIKDERFILLLDSAIEREKMLHQYKTWFDCSNMELREAITSILVTEDFLQRVEVADEWRENSTYLYYKNLYEKIREQKQIYFPDLVPPSADRLLSHYRFLPEMGTAVAFLEEFTVMSKTLINEEGLGTTIHRCAGFPIPLPEPLLSEINSLSDPDLSAFVKGLLKSAGSPLSKMHMIKILVHLAEKRPSFYRLARRIAKSMFTENSIAEFMAFSSLLRWIHHEFIHWKETDRWQPHILVAMVWAHTHQLFSIFLAVGIPPEWINETFTMANRRLSIELFNRDNSLWFDVAHPRNLSFPVFTLMGLADSVEQQENMVFDQVLRDIFTEVGFQKINDLSLPASPFLMDNKRAANALGTFLGGSFSEKLFIIFGEELIRVFRNEGYESIASEAVTLLIEEPKNFPSWVSLRIIIRGYPPYDSLSEKLLQLFTQTNFENLLIDDFENGLATMEFAAWQLIHLQEKELKQHLKAQYKNVLTYFASRGISISNPNNSSIDSPSLRLIEIALNIAVCNPTINEMISEFNELLSEIAAHLPETSPIIKSLAQYLCEELPIEHGQHFGNLLLRLRTDR